MSMMSNKGKGPRLVSIRIAVVLLLSIGAFGGTYMYLGGVKQMTTVAIAKATVPAGFVFDHTTMADLVQITGSLPAYAGSTVNMIDASQSDWFVAYDGKVLTNTLHPGDPVRVSDFYLPRETKCVADARAVVMGNGESTATPAPDASGSPAPTASPTPAPTSAVPTPAPTTAPGQGLTAILDAKQRALVISGDPTSSYIRPGDYLDLFLISGTGVDAQVSWLMTRCVIYTIPRPAPDLSSSETSSYTPGGTSFVLDLTIDDVQNLLFASNVGQIRVALGSPSLLADEQTARPKKLTANAKSFYIDFGIDIAAQDENQTATDTGGAGGDTGTNDTTIPIGPLTP